MEQVGGRRELGGLWRVGIYVRGARVWYVCMYAGLPSRLSASLGCLLFFLFFFEVVLSFLAWFDGWGVLRVWGGGGEAGEGCVCCERRWRRREEAWWV